MIARPNEYKVGMQFPSRIFQDGDSQAVRLPKEVAFPPSVQDGLVFREGSRLIIEPAPVRSFTPKFFEALSQWPEFERPTQTHQDRGPMFP